jgi:hypothetical protein
MEKVGTGAANFRRIAGFYRGLDAFRDGDQNVVLRQLRLVMRSLSQNAGRFALRGGESVSIEE